MTRRLYNINFDNISVSSLGDIAGAVAAANRITELAGIFLDNVDNPIGSAQMLRFQLQNFTGTVTQGTGFSAATPVPTDLGDPAATTTGWTGPCSALATSTGAFKKLLTFGCHVWQGKSLLFDQGTFMAVNLEGFVLQMQAAPQATFKVSGRLLIAEYGINP